MFMCYNVSDDVINKYQKYQQEVPIEKFREENIICINYLKQNLYSIDTS